MERRYLLLVFSVLVLLAPALATVPSTAAGAAPADEAPIRLESGTFTPAGGPAPASDAANASRYWVVQFRGPVRSEWRADLEALGAEILAYVPDFAFKVRMTGTAAAVAAGLDSVRWVGPFEPEYKTSPDLASAGLYRIRIERGASTAGVAAAVARSGATVIVRERDLMVVAADAAQIEAIAAVADVAWIEDLVLREKHNEFGAGAIVGANIANASGYDGSTQTVAVADTGIGDGTAAGAHPDIPADRVVAVQNFQGADSGGCYTVLGDGARDVDSGHGTHVAVSVLGDGNASGLGTGTAPAAGLVFQATEDYVDFTGFCSIVYADGYYLLGLPEDLQDLFRRAYDAGARIHSDSWGSDAAGGYTLDSASTDAFVWAQPDMTITFSAGNAGIDGNADGVVDADSIGSPATAKNVLTVGASENDRLGDWSCDTGIGNGCTGQNDIFTYGSVWPSDYPAAPIADDPSAGNAEQMAAFSSRGPTDDGRIKPDVVAPGTWILSGYSDLYQEGYDGVTNPQNGVFQYDGWGYPHDSDYKYMGGTSMSNPIAAGAAAVVRDYYVKAHGHSASAALTKATLINSAVDLLDENNDGADDNDHPIPNIHEGWGRVDVAGAVDGSAQWVDEPSGVTTGGSTTYTFATTGVADFKVSLVWSDHPSTEAAAVNLVNDLDLTVSGPDGTYRGNVFGGGWSVTGGSADRVNNVENVYVQAAGAGTWTVTVEGFNVPFGPQPFALVVEGAGSGGDAAPTVAVTNPTEGATIAGLETISADATDDDDVVAVEFTVDGRVVATDTDGSDGWSALWDTTTVGDGNHSVAATATDSAGQTAFDSVVVAVDNVNDNPVAGFSWSCDGLSCDLDAATSFDADGEVVDYSWTFGDGQVGSGITVTHRYAAPDSYDVTLVVTDDRGAIGTDTQQVSPSEPPTNTIHVADLDASSADAPRGRWDATVTVTVHDGAHAAVSGASVTGTWSGGASGSDSCQTAGDGTCSISKVNLKGNLDQVTFTVTEVLAGAAGYAPADNHDPDGDSDGTVVTVAKLSNQPPTASFTWVCLDELLWCDFDASASSDSDGSIVSYAWDWGDDTGNTTTNPQVGVLYGSAGAYQVTLVVTDDRGAAGTETQLVVVGDVAVPTVHVGDLDGGSAPARGGKWDATVTITVHDEAETPVAGAAVSGTWSDGASGSGSCTTDARGVCSVTVTNLGRNAAQATFSIGGVSHPSSTYDPTSNHDPDGDGDGTQITVTKP